MQGQRVDAVHAPAAQADQRGGFLHAALVQMVAQRRTGVAHGVAAHPLGAVDVAQRGIAEPGKVRSIDGIHGAHGEGRGLAAGKLGRAKPGHYHLMGHQHAALGAGRTGGQGGGDGAVVIGQVGLGHVMAHGGGAHEGQQRELHGAEAVVEDDLPRCAPELPGDVYVLVGQQPGGVVQPLGAVMVAGHGQHGDAPGGQLGQKPVQQGAGGGGGHGGVVNIARQHHGVHLIAVTQR